MLVARRASLICSLELGETLGFCLQAMGLGPHRLEVEAMPGASSPKPGMADRGVTDEARYERTPSVTG